MRRVIVAVFILFFVGTCSAEELASSVISVKSPEVALTPVKKHFTEVFMELDNKGKRAHSLIAVFSPEAKQAQLHQVVKHNGHKWMEKAKYILIKPHGRSSLQADGFHIMLLGLNGQLHNSEQVPVVLLFRDGSWIKVKATVA